MRYVVGTVKDSLSNTTRFIEQNLLAGADFIFVFSEDAGDDVAAYLSGHELVMHVPSGPDGGHWGDDRPANIYLRQNTNANLVRTMLAACPWASWLFHLDGDEVLDIDTHELDSLSSDVRAVRLSPLESVAATTDGWDGYFKYPLDKQSLALLYSLGAIAEPTQRALYNGHVIGKVGIRPSLDYRIEIHAAKAGDDEIAAHSSEELRMLHYDSFNADEFVRKWMAKIGNDGARQRSQRLTIRSAVEAATQLSHLPDDRRAEILREIYQRHVADEVDLLAELNFLTCPDHKRHQYEPRRHAPEQLAAMTELLTLLAEDLAAFDPARPLGDQRQALEKALARASMATTSITELEPMPPEAVDRPDANDAVTDSSAPPSAPIRQRTHAVTKPRQAKRSPRRLAHRVPHGVRAKIPPGIRQWVGSRLDTIFGSHS